MPGRLMLQSSTTRGRTGIGQMGKTIQYSAAFKQEAMQELLSGIKRPTQICRERRIDQTTLRRWRLQYEERGASAWSEVAPAGVVAEEEKIAELERVIGRLTVENLALKKALAHAHSLSRNGSSSSSR
jgi:transposase